MPVAGGPPAERVLAAALVGLTVLALTATIVVAWVHADDRYRVDHVGGSRIAMAWYVNEGTLYPQLSDDGFYGGTRWMPLPVLLHAGAARVTGEYLVSGKVLAYMTMATLILVTFLVIRRLGCPWPLAAALASLLLLTQAGFGLTMSLRADALPVLLQVSSVWLATSRPHRSATPVAMIVAALLAALALAAKLSAVWAPIAVVLWLFRRNRRSVSWFVGGYVVWAVGLLGLFSALSGGRMLSNVLGLAGAGLAEGGLLRAPYRLVLLAIDHATPIWFLMPAAAVAGWYAFRGRRDEEWLLALLAASAILVVVLADVGADWNHLIDIAVLVLIVVGGLVGRTLPSLPYERVAGTAVVLMVLWVGVTGLVTVVLPEARHVVRLADPTTDPQLDPQPLRGLASSETPILSEDPYVPVSLGQRPVLLDPFMVERIVEVDREIQAELLRRIDAKEFELVVLLRRVENRDIAWWWEDFHLGPEIAAEIRDSYDYQLSRGPYHIYAPAEAS